MFDMTIQAKNGLTNLAVRPGGLNEAGSLLLRSLDGQPCPMVAVVTDQTVGPLYVDRVVQSLQDARLATHVHRIESGESSKSLKVLEDVYRFFSGIGLSRDGMVLALGGGVVSDLAGYAAATWMRGVNFAICPTTLEADIDASIGGKTAINIPGGKNLVGAFHQPCCVVIDPNCLNSLDPRDVCAGMAESVKHALIRSDEFLVWHVENADAILTLDKTVMTELILRNLRIKADFVEQDPKEKSGQRMMLNLGHTIGHAIEECCSYSLRHGECVSLGLLAACRMSASLGLLDGTVVDRVETVLTKFNLPTQLVKPIDTDQILSTIQNDKKKRGNQVRLVLLEDIGRPVIRDDVDEKQIREAYESLIL